MFTNPVLKFLILICFCSIPLYSESWDEKISQIKEDQREIQQIIEEDQVIEVEQEEGTQQNKDKTIEKEKDNNNQTQKNLSIDNCGQNHLNYKWIDEKIVGGQEAKIGQFPWQVMLRVEKGNPSQPTLCGGSIINKNWILTAAHCVSDERNGRSTVTRVEVTAGLHNRKFRGSKAQTKSVDCVIQHEKWTGFSGGFANDLALLRIPNKDSIEITHKSGGIVNAICMPPKTTPPFESTGNARISGWGMTGSGGRSSDVLKYTDVGLIDDNTCRKKSNFPFPIVDSMLCQGIDRTSPCFGDSGGPLIVKLDQRYVQVGVVSTGPQQCANDKDPNGIYTQVSYFLDWIERNIQESNGNSKCKGKQLRS